MVLSIVDSQQYQLPVHSKSVWMYFANMKIRLSVDGMQLTYSRVDLLIELKPYIIHYWGMLIQTRSLPSSQLTTLVLSSEMETPVLWGLTTSMQITSVVKCLGQSEGISQHRDVCRQQ